MSASAKALRLCINDQTTVYSYIDMHKITNRATPSQMLLYKHAILLFKLYNTLNSTSDWVKLNFQQTLTSRQVNFKISQTNKYKIGLNLIGNRLTVLNNKIPLKWLFLSIKSFKLKCKERFLQLFYMMGYVDQPNPRNQSTQVQLTLVHRIPGNGQQIPMTIFYFSSYIILLFYQILISNNSLYVKFLVCANEQLN